MCRKCFLLLSMILLPAVSVNAAAPSPINMEADSGSGRFVEMPAEVLEDKIRGGLLAQLLGNLNGLPHENKYYDEPGNVEEYTPALPDGARTDDDTDIEWVYIVAMQRARTAMLGPEQITELWKKHINQRIWCSNLYVRRLMDIGIDPPLTGSLALNPWANFNISGQFVCETFGLIAPAMPQTAGRIGLNYTHVSIDGEPAQTTQLFTAMISTAFITSDINAILDAGVTSIDPNSEIVPIIADVRRWHQKHSDDWRKTRRLVRDKYTLYESRTRNQNGYELCTAATVGALLYGEGDLVKTLIHAFNFGWDADNNAATAATIVGVIKGQGWMRQQGWEIKDTYRNTTRPLMPENETITSFGDRIIEVAHHVITENGGATLWNDGVIFYRIQVQEPGNVESLTDADKQVDALRSAMRPQIRAGLADGATVVQQSRAGYLAICLGLAESVRRRHPDRWTQALAALHKQPKLLEVMFSRSPGPAGDKLRTAAAAAGLQKPVRQKPRSR
ncbi:MAG: ADP-ribosylglycohydrolase family protein [Planctomycetota bacterium]